MTTNRKYFGAHLYDVFADHKRGALQVEICVDALSCESLAPVVTVEAPNRQVAKILIRERIALLTGGKS